MDNLTSEQRRKNMQHIRSKDTKIEGLLRKALWKKGYRFRKNYKELPGKPDIVFTKYKIAIFCDGEFFHGKDWEVLKPRLEKSNNSEYWISKISRNKERDDEINKKLLFLGWTVIRFWGNDIKKNTDECIRVIEDPFGKRRIDMVRISDAKCWLIHLQQVEKKSYSSIHSIRGVLRPAFQLAVDDDLIRKNSFQFQLMEVVVNDSVTREAISRAEERKFLRFVKEDPHFCRYYEGIYILFKTGLRISEFCGLTISDIDFKEHTINIDHQLQKKSKIGYYIQETKTTSGTRKIPMTADVEECFRKIIEKRNPPKAEPMVDGKSGFLYFDKNESICYSLHWEHYFQHIIQKYNNTYKVQMPVITPHVCRHTYCSNMAKSGMNPKTLQYLMGHSDISVTMNVYTHIGFDDAEEELKRMEEFRKAQAEVEQKKEKPMSQKMFKGV